MKEKLKQTKGITLIALIITIIVLLILAGVSIALLTGKNGILTQANKSKIDTEKATTLEEIQVEVLGSYETDGEINFDKLNLNLSKIGIENSNVQSLPSKKISKNGYNFMIDRQGNVVEYKNMFSNLFEKNEEDLNSLHIGDFVDYDAGTWTKEEITKANGSNSSALPTKYGGFGGYVVGDSRNGNATPFSTDYAATSSGWRLWDIDKENNTVTLISAGNPEDYYHHAELGHFYSERYLSGNINSRATEVEAKNLMSKKIRDWSMYVNLNQYAINANCITKQDLDNWYIKYLNIANANTWDATTFKAVLNTKYESLVDNHSYYWLAYTHNYWVYPAAYLEYISAGGPALYYNGSIAFGIRILVTLPSDVEIEKSTENKIISTREGTDYAYNVWKIK